MRILENKSSCLPLSGNVDNILVTERNCRADSFHQHFAKSEHVSVSTKSNWLRKRCLKTNLTYKPRVASCSIPAFFLHATFTYS